MNRRFEAKGRKREIILGSYRGLLLAAALLLSLADFAWAAAAPTTVDAARAEQAARRADRDPAEGVWSVNQDWDPSLEQAHNYRIAIVRNSYGVFKEAKYLGVAICVKEGVTTGEVRLLLTPAEGGEKGAYDAVWRAAGREARGIARLEDDGSGVPDTALDLRTLTMDGHILVKWLLRIPL